MIFSKIVKKFCEKAKSLSVRLQIAVKFEYYFQSLCLQDPLGEKSL